jgi:DnaJ domain
LKDYYAILDLSITARDAEIKRAYRQLALRYHPDKNKSPEADGLIKEINEAYDVLSDPEQKLMYDQLLTGVVQFVQPEPEPTAPRHRDPRYQPKSAEYIQEIRKNSFHTYMRNNLKYAVLISKFTFAFALFCMIDFALPSRKETHTVANTSNTAERRRTSGAFVIYFENGMGVKLSHELEESFVKGDKINYYTSLLLSVPIKIENQRTDFLTRVPLSFYGNFLFPRLGSCPHEPTL